MCSFRSLIFTRTSSCGHTLSYSPLVLQALPISPSALPSIRAVSVIGLCRQNPPPTRDWGSELPFAQQRAPRTAGALSPRTRLTLFFPRETRRCRRHNAQASKSSVWQPGQNRACVSHTPLLRRRTGLPSRHHPSSPPFGFTQLTDPSSHPAAPAPRSVVGPSCTLTGAGSEASSRSQSGPPEETPS